MRTERIRRVERTLASLAVSLAASIVFATSGLAQVPAPHGTAAEFGDRPLRVQRVQAQAPAPTAPAPGTQIEAPVPPLAPPHLYRRRRFLRKPRLP
jgi:hypothetical protein